MKKRRGLKSCCLCGCCSTNKIYLSVPESRKTDWYNHTKVSKILMRGPVFCCEDHFDVCTFLKHIFINNKYNYIVLAPQRSEKL